MLGGLRSAKSSYQPLSMRFKWSKTTHCNMRCVNRQTGEGSFKELRSPKLLKPGQDSGLGAQLDWGFCTNTRTDMGQKDQSNPRCADKSAEQRCIPFFFFFLVSLPLTLKIEQIHVAHLSCNAPGLNPQYSKPQILTAQKGCLQLWVLFQACLSVLSVTGT